MQTILTLGPATQTEEIITELLGVADGFRLNSSHLTPEQLLKWLDKLSTIFSRTDRTLPVIIDLQGAKMRIGEYPDVPELPNDKVTLLLQNKTDTSSIIPVPHEELFQELRAGDVLTLNDTRIILEIIDVSPNEALAAVLKNGPLCSLKGINRTRHPVPYRVMTNKDKETIELCQKFPFTHYAFSFVLNGEEAALLRPATGQKQLIAKIERPEALSHLSTIDSKFDAIWFCRGDLGAQAGVENLGSLQEQFVTAFEILKSPKYLAGQVLEHMSHFPEPTRSEVVHLHDIQKAGFDGIILSDETAIGKYPLEVASFLKRFRSRNLA